MPYTVKTEGMEELTRMLEGLGNAAQGVAAQGLYEGAGIVADSVSQAVHGIATKRFKYPAPPGKQRMPSPEERPYWRTLRREYQNSGRTDSV